MRFSSSGAVEKNSSFVMLPAVHCTRSSSRRVFAPSYSAWPGHSAGAADAASWTCSSLASTASDMKRSTMSPRRPRPPQPPAVLPGQM